MCVYDVFRRAGNRAWELVASGGQLHGLTRHSSPAADDVQLCAYCSEADDVQQCVCMMFRRADNRAGQLVASGGQLHGLPRHHSPAVCIMFSCVYDVQQLV